MAWTTINNKLVREYSFPNFIDALSFVNAVGKIAEEHQHHPDIFLAWGYVRIELWTHDSGGITEKDYALAHELDSKPLTQ